MLKFPGSNRVEEYARVLEGERDLASSGLERLEGPEAQLLRTQVNFQDEPVAEPDSRIQNAIEVLKVEIRERYNGRIRELRSERDRLESLNFDTPAKQGMATPAATGPNK